MNSFYQGSLFAICKASIDHTKRRLAEESRNANSKPSINITINLSGTISSNSDIEKIIKPTKQSLMTFK